MGQREVIVWPIQAATKPDGDTTLFEVSAIDIKIQRKPISATGNAGDRVVQTDRK